MTAADALAGMLALYATPGAWTPEGVARDTAGLQVSPTSPDAVAWSLEGALYRVVGDPEADGITEVEATRRETLTSAVFDACGVDLMAFNDAARHQRLVVEVLRHSRGHVLTWKRDRAASSHWGAVNRMDTRSRENVGACSCGERL